MGIRIFAVFALVLVLMLGCIQPQISSAVPADLEITYGYGACHAEWGRTTLTIDAKGHGTSGNEGGQGMDALVNLISKKSFTLSEKELLALLNGIESSGFYSLGDSYSDLLVQDGSCSFISVTKNNSTKTVSVSNTAAPEAFSKAADLISAASSK
ncbi:MAG: hypothetical protein WC488_03400 [Candidatus Micrarchaeia archaeon]